MTKAPAKTAAKTARKTAKTPPQGAKANAATATTSTATKPRQRRAAAPATEPAKAAKKTAPRKPRTVKNAVATVPGQAAFPVLTRSDVTLMDGWEQQEILGGENTINEIFGDEDKGIGTDVLAIMIAQAKTLGTAPIVREQIVVRHDIYGDFKLRAVHYPQGGFLIGVIDRNGATYGATEFYGDEYAAAKGFDEWLGACLA